MLIFHLVSSLGDNLKEEKQTAHKIKLSERLKQRRINEQISDSQVMNSTSQVESEAASDKNKYSINVPSRDKMKYKGAFSHRNMEKTSVNPSPSEASAPQDSAKNSSCKLFYSTKFINFIT